MRQAVFIAPGLVPGTDGAAAASGPTLNDRTLGGAVPAINFNGGGGGSGGGSGVPGGPRVSPDPRLHPPGCNSFTR